MGISLQCLQEIAGSMSLETRQRCFGERQPPAQAAACEKACMCKGMPAQQATCLPALEMLVCGAPPPNYPAWLCYLFHR